MDRLQPYWEILRDFGIEKPCRVFLSGPFEADEVALRFILYKLGFTLLDRWNAGAAQWTIIGQGASAPGPADNNHTEERLAAPALLGAASPFHLLSEAPSAQGRRHNLYKLLKNQNDKNFQLGLTLIENGGITTPFLEQVLVAWYLHYRQKDKAKTRLFFRRMAAWLPDSLQDILRENPYSLPFTLGAVRNELPLFSPLRFLELLEEEQYFPFERFEPVKELYAETARGREEAWRRISSADALYLKPEHLWVIADLPADGWDIELSGKLSLEETPWPESLDLLLERHPNFFSGLKSLAIKRAGEPALHIIGQKAHQLELLNIEIATPVSVAFLLENLSTRSLQALVIRSTHRRRAEIGLPSESFPKAAALAANIRRLSFTGFRGLNLRGIELFRNLRILCLNNNGLIALPADIGKLQQLKTLSLFEPKLGSLPASFFALSLEKLWLGSNQLPDDIKNALGKAFPEEVFRNDMGLR